MTRCASRFVTAQTVGYSDVVQCMKAQGHSKKPRHLFVDKKTGERTEWSDAQQETGWRAQV